MWVYDTLEPGARKVIPSCIVSAIRRNFPEKTGVCTGFIEGDDDDDAETVYDSS